MATNDYAPTDQAAFDARAVGLRVQSADASSYYIDFISAGRFREYNQGETHSGRYTYEKTGANAGTLTTVYDNGDRCTITVTFNAPDAGAADFSCNNGTVTDSLSWRLADTPGDATLNGTAGNDSLTGTAGADTLNGREGNDNLYGGAGADALNGGPGSDYAYYLDSPSGVVVRLHDAGAARFGHAQGDMLTGIEHLVGSNHNDTLAGDGEDNVLEGRDGHDVLYGGPAGGDDRMDGGNGDDRVFGGKGDDTLIGGAGNDYLKGGAGQDVLIVDGDDMDVLYGGPDRDTFRFFPSDLGGGSIPDFSDGEDVIDLTQFPDVDSMDDLDITSYGNNVRIELSGTDYLTTIILSGFDVANLDSSDFLF